jgi:hypothetical protein
MCRNEMQTRIDCFRLTLASHYFQYAQKSAGNDDVVKIASVVKCMQNFLLQNEVMHNLMPDSVRV